MSEALLSSINIKSLTTSSGPALYSFDLPNITPSAASTFEYNQTITWDEPGTFALLYASSLSGKPYGGAEYTLSTPIMQFWALSCPTLKVMCGCHPNGRYQSPDYVIFMPLTATNTSTSITLTGSMSYNSSRGWYVSTDLIGNSDGYNPLSITGIKLMIF